MKFTHILFLFFVWLLPAVNANFDIYAVQILNARNLFVYQEGVSIFVNDPGQDTILRARIWPWKDDVSGGKLGIKCHGDGCQKLNSRPSDIKELEMNFLNGPVYHWSKCCPLLMPPIIPSCVNQRSL